MGNKVDDGVASMESKGKWMLHVPSEHDHALRYLGMTEVVGNALCQSQPSCCLSESSALRLLDISRNVYTT